MDMQHIEFSGGSAASAALAEAFDCFARALDDFNLSEIRAAAAVGSVPGWARPKGKPPPSIGRGQSWIRVVQRTVKASGRLHLPTTDTTSPNLHKITRAAPDGSGPLPLERSGRHDRCNQRRRADPAGAAEPGAEGCGVPGNLPRLFVSASRDGTDGRAGCGGCRHKLRVRFESHAALHDAPGPPTGSADIPPNFIFSLFQSLPGWGWPPAHQNHMPVSSTG